MGGSVARGGAGKDGGVGRVDARCEGDVGGAGAWIDWEGGGLAGACIDGPVGTVVGIECETGWAGAGIECPGAGGTGSGDGARAGTGGNEGARLEGMGAGGGKDGVVAGGTEAGGPDASGNESVTGTTGPGDGGGVRWIRRTRGVGSSSKPSSLG